MKKLRASDLLLASFVIAVGALLLVPLPTRLLDFLIVINFAVSLLLLLAGLYLPHALALLSFPSLLLLTTLFRLGLNVASTRLILTQADAGRVIEAFGLYLVRGEVAVGLIIFFILSAVNFVVITRGAGRVSEVAARFTLDALPGRQMSIDSDLRSGLISAEEAQRQRENLSKESQLYGAMDGAMKFVQGDAVVGLLIIFVNLIGGLYLGVSNGMSFSEATETYSILTVGDGLVNQVPAILIAICAGLVVTRVAAADGVSLAEDVRAQVFAKPPALLFSALILLVLSSLEGLPTLPFVLVAILLSMFAWLQYRAVSADKYVVENANQALGLGYNAADKQRGLQTLSSSNTREFILHVDAQRLFPVWKRKSDQFQVWWDANRKILSGFLGLPLPVFQVVPSVDLGSGEYELKSNGFRLFKGSLAVQAFLVELSPSCCHLFGLDPLGIERHPILDKTIIWANLNDRQIKYLRAANIRVFDEFQVIALNLVKYSCKNPQEFFSVSDILSLEAKLERSKPGLLSDALARQFFSASRITEIAYELIRQSVPIGDYTSLVEILSQYGATVGASLIAEGEFDLSDIVSFIRLSRSQQSLSNSETSRGRLVVIKADSEIDAKIADSPKAMLEEAFEPQLIKQLMNLAELASCNSEGEVLLAVREDLRTRYSALMTDCCIPLRVVALSEVERWAGKECIACWRSNEF